MEQNHKLSLTAAILVNLNIMIGAGLFINSVEIAKRSGFLGFLVYGLVGLLLLPLIIGMAQLVRIYPEGGFFTYAQEEIGPWAAFISSWSYFVGKLGSATLLIHTAFLLLRQIIPIFANISIFLLDTITLALFIALNLRNLKTGKTVQAWLMAFKLIPLLFVIFSGMYLFNPGAIASSAIITTGISSTIPLVLFAFLGFEATCSLSTNIADARKNGPRAILISYGLVIALYMGYQFFLYHAIGDSLGYFTSYLAVFPALLQKLSLNNHLIQSLLNCAIAASALGGSYGILFSNSWNLYMLAKKNYIPGASLFAQRNTQAMPTGSVIAQGVICLFYLWFTQGAQIPLQLTSVLGSITAYTISVISLVLLYQRKKDIVTIPGWLLYSALASCLLLITFCVRNVVLLGTAKLAGFIALVLLGIAAFFIKERTSRMQSK